MNKIKKLTTLRKMLIIPFIDFKPVSVLDIPKILMNSFFYDLDALLRVFLTSANLKIDWHKIGNPRAPFGCKIKTRYKGVPLNFEIRPNSDDFYFLKPKYEEDYLEFFSPKKGDIVLDVGSHVGRYTCYSGKLVGEKGKVISIEANPYNYEQLLRNIRLNELEDVVYAYNFVASDINGFAEITIPKDHGRTSLMNDRVFGKKIRVKSVRLEDLLNKHDIENINWMKIDVEGAEIRVLKGLGSYLNKIENILIEVSSENEMDFLGIMKKYKFYVKPLLRYSEQIYYFAHKEL